MKELKYIIGIVVLVTLNSCANRGRPSGGDYDITPPAIIKYMGVNQNRRMSKGYSFVRDCSTVTG